MVQYHANTGFACDIIPGPRRVLYMSALPKAACSSQGCLLFSRLPALLADARIEHGKVEEGGPRARRREDPERDGGRTQSATEGGTGRGPFTG